MGHKKLEGVRYSSKQSKMTTASILVIYRESARRHHWSNKANVIQVRLNLGLNCHRFCVKACIGKSSKYNIMSFKRTTDD